ncbi:MAG: cytochrome c oxidase subunit I, partial [Planctomycetes bacterium]|nr:cytochrome c oxidase subunit I [Planctomycetota bacterium]
MDPHASHGTEHAHPELGFLRKYIFADDHKIIGLQFLFTGLIFLGLGGILALLVRIQLAWPHAEIPILHSYFADNGGRISESFYNM